MRFLNENLFYFFIYLSIVKYYLFHSGYERQWVFLLVAVAGTMNQILYSHRLRSCVNKHVNPANTRRWSNAGVILGQRRRQWANINPALGQRLVLAGNLAANGCTASFPRLGQRFRRWPNIETTMYSRFALLGIVHSAGMRTLIPPESAWGEGQWECRRNPAMTPLTKDSAPFNSQCHLKGKSPVIV